jgi:predicted DNA-binding protein (MmcQ/YjbR family)
MNHMKRLEAVDSKLPEALRVLPAGYGLGRHGWVSLSVEPDAGQERWEQIAEWVRTSYALVVWKRLAQLVLIEDGLA